jgi:hypothetical protein
MVGKPKICMYGGCSNGVPPISVSASIATFQSSNANPPLRLLRHLKKGSFKTAVTPFSRSGWSVVRSASLAKGGTWKKRQSPHLHKFPTRSNKVSPRTLQTALVFTGKAAPVPKHYAIKVYMGHGGNCDLESSALNRGQWRSSGLWRRVVMG